MMLTKGAIGNLINRYSAVLKKCSLINTFGSLAVAGMLVVGGVSGAVAEDAIPQWEDVPTNPTTTIDLPNASKNDNIATNQTIVVKGENTYGGADTSSAIGGKENNTTYINEGKIWVISGELKHGTTSDGTPGINGYAQGMGNYYDVSATMTNKGTIYVDGRDAWKAKAMGVDPNGNAINEGTIIIKKGSGIADNSGSTAKTIANKDGKIYVTEEGGIGIFHRKEALDDGDVKNEGLIAATNGGIGVVLTNDKDDTSYNNKIFTNGGTITADDKSTAILVKGTTGATIKLTSDSNITGLINLAGIDNKLDISDVGAAAATEELYVTSNDLANLNMVNSHIVFTDKSQFTLTGSSTIDEDSTVTMGNVTFAQGDTLGNNKSLISLAQGALTLNGGLKTKSSDSGAEDPIATLGKLEKTTTGTKLTGIDFQNHTITVVNNNPIASLISATLDNDHIKISGTAEEHAAFINNQYIFEKAMGSPAAAVLGIHATENSSVFLDYVDIKNNTSTGTNVYINGVYGGAIGISGESKTILNNVIIENNHAISNGSSSWQVQGGAFYQASSANNDNSKVIAKDITVKNNSGKSLGTQTASNVQGGGMVLYGVSGEFKNASFTDNIAQSSLADATGGGLNVNSGYWADSGKTLSIQNSSFTQNQAIGNNALGGGLYLKSFNYNDNNYTLSATLTDVDFDNNIANGGTNAHGGALYATGLALTINVNDSVKYTGNTLQGEATDKSGGFLYLGGGETWTNTEVNSSAIFNIADKAILTIGAVDADYATDKNLDSIAGVASAILTKQGAGTMVVNSLLNDFLGTVNVEAGTMQVAKTWNIANTVNVSGGTLDLANFNFGNNGTIALSATGTLKTGSANVFTAALDDAGTTVTDAEALKSSNITFSNGGGVVLTDANYNIKYAESANTLVKDAGGQKVAMLGNLIQDANDNTVENNTINIDNLPDSAGSGTILAKVEATTDNKDLVIGGEGSSGYATRTNDLGVKSIDLGTASNVTVQGGKTLTLVGGGDSLIKTTQQDVTLTVTSGKVQLGAEGANSGGTLNGSVNMTEGSLNTVSGNFSVTGNITGDSASTVSAAAGGTLNVAGDIGADDAAVATVATTGGAIIAKAIHTATVKADKGIVQATAMTLGTGDTSLTNGAVVMAEALTATSGTTITVGSTEGGAGTLIAKEANLNGASLFLDPAWKGNDEIGDASKAGLVFANNAVNGLLTVGQNSFILLGDTDTKWAESTFANSGLKWGADNVTAALFVRKSQTIAAATGGIKVDGDLKTGSSSLAEVNKVIFADKSLLVVDGIAMTKDAALKGTSNSSVLTVDAGSKLLIANGKAGDTVHIVSDFKTEGSTLNDWSGTNLITDSKLLTAKETGAFTKENGAYDVTLSQNNASGIFPKLDKNLGTQIDGMVREIGLDTNSDNYGQRFISRAVSDSYIGTTNAKEAAATVEGAAKIAFAGAAPQMAMNLASAAGNVAGLRNSLAAAPQGTAVAMNDEGVIYREGLSAGDGMKNGFGLWVMPMYQNQQGFGLESGEFETGYKSNAAGVALGADYTFNDMFRVGAQFNVGGGYAESTGDFNSTDNRFNYWGLGLYAGYQYQNIGVTADFGYSSNNNEIEQSLPSTMQMEKLKADAKSDTFTVGLRGEYKFATEAMDIVPHLGVRMTNMHMGSFDVKSGDHKVFKADDVNATVWTFPVGVTFSKDIETSNGWTVKPSLDLAIVPAAGDIEAKQDVKIAGVNGSAQVESSIMDSISYQGSLGLSAKNDNGVSVGVNYTLQAGAHTTDHGVQATFRYDF